MLGASLLWGVKHWLGSPEELQALWIAFVGIASTLAVIGFVLALSLWPQATAISAEGRFPTRSMRTAPIRRGAAAQRVTSALRLAAAAAALMSFTLLCWMVVAGVLLA